MSVRRVACAVSGGVDSAVAAYLLTQRGFDVTGVFMTNWDEQDELGHCSGQRDLQDAQRVCQHLNIPLLHLNFAKEYWNDVFLKTLSAYSRGQTPNPDVLCNKYIKFDSLYHHCVQKLGFDALATGHYARSSFGQFLQHRDPNSKVKLLCAADKVKDQTFWLCQVQQLALQRSMFPIGGLLKPRVKQLCREIGLASIAARRESAGMCFIGKRSFSNFISQYLQPSPGQFVLLETGQVVGHGHTGVHNFTIGQRPQLSIDHERYYVAKLCAKTGTVHIVAGNHHPALYYTTFHCDSPHWIDSEPVEFTSTGKLQCELKWQNKWSSVQCVLTRAQNGSGISIELSQPMRCISPGQYAVFYINNQCIGSALITQSVSLYDQGCYRPIDWDCNDFLLSYGDNNHHDHHDHQDVTAV